MGFDFICCLRFKVLHVITPCSWWKVSDAPVLRWPFSENPGPGSQWPGCRVLTIRDKTAGAVTAVITCRGLIWIQIFAITDFIMFSFMWRQIASLVFSIQVTFADNFYTQFVMLFDAAGFSENPTLCSAPDAGFLFSSELGFYFIYHRQNCGDIQIWI